MGNPFEDAAAASSRAVDAVYGNPWLFQPTDADDPDGRRAPDPDRAAFAIIGAWIDPYARAGSGPARRQGVKAEHPGHASSRPFLDVDVTQFGQGLPRRGDRLQRLDPDALAQGVNKPVGPLYEVAEFRPDGTGRAEIDVNLLSR
jgi:hypothetical protein